MIDRGTELPYNKKNFYTAGKRAMQTKLTIRMDERLIVQAKGVARKRGKSLSRLVAGYFSSLEKDTPSHHSNQISLTPLVRSLKGSLKGIRLDKEAYHQYLEKKYR
jgi:hypothetical protein